MKRQAKDSNSYLKTRIMKRFKFRLDPVVRYRQHLYRMALADVAKAKHSLIETTNRIRQIKHSRKAAVNELECEQDKGIGINRHRTYSAYMDGLDQQIESERNILAENSKTVKERQTAAETKRIGKETFERLKQTEHTKYLETVNRAEQKATDELVGLKRKAREF